MTSGCSNCAGKVNVFVDSGNGEGCVLETISVDKSYNNGQEVMNNCYDGLEGVQVHGPSSNAWGGVISLLFDDGNNWTPFVCLDCTGSSNTMPIAVSGDGTDFGWSTKCKNGATCTLVLSIVTKRRFKDDDLNDFYNLCSSYFCAFVIMSSPQTKFS